MTTTAQPVPHPVIHPGVPLSTALRDGSRDEHEAAEATPFVRDLFGPGVTRERYAAYLHRLLGVYATLERLVHAAPGHHAVAGFRDPALDRAPALRDDLAHWAPGVRGGATSPAVHAYADRLAEAAGSPVLLLAHHYTRYLGDLAGGQAVGAVLARRHGLAEGGLAFYAFAGIGRPRAYREAYRARLDALPLGVPERAALVAEVRTAFRLNVALLREL